MRISVHGIRTALLTSLGFAALAGCGGATDGNDAGGGSAGTGGSGNSTQGGASGTPQGGAGNTTQGGSGNSTQGGSAGSGGDINTCRNPTPIAYDVSSGVAEIVAAPGFIECEGGWVHRPVATQCSYIPRDVAIVNPTMMPAGCERDSDCTERPYGYCDLRGYFQAPTPPACSYGCGNDSDCAAGEICLCGNPAGRCMPASCATDSDCPGSLCAGTPFDPVCGGPRTFRFACPRAEDECRSPADCPLPRSMCVPGPSGALVCQGSPVCGRPFLVQGAARTADAARVPGWTELALPETSTLDLETRRALAEHWTSLGLMEHASVAAFARFALELLALGAPADLVAATQRALGDEVEHAKLCFGLASAYAAAPVGPSALALDGALEPRTAFDIVRTAFLEACVGETLAAVEAATLIEHATDPVVRAALERIAADEARHAELGFQFVKWALDTAPLAERLDLEHAIESLLAAELERRVASSNEVDRLAHGVASAELRREARRVALVEVVAPCVRALLGPARAAA